MMGVGHGETSCSRANPPVWKWFSADGRIALQVKDLSRLPKIARSSGARNPWGERPLVLAYQRAAMGDPTHPSSVPPHDAEPVTSLDDAPRSGAHTTSEEVVPLAEEIATIAKRQVVTGRVRVQTLTDTAEELAKATLKSDTVEVTRVPVDKVVETAPEIRTEGNVTIVPVLEEVLVVEKRLVLKEELHIRRRATTETAEVPVTLRKQRVVVERIDPDKATGD
jgi:uncharacterized protein (TIGR02271 family)